MEEDEEEEDEEKEDEEEEEEENKEEEEEEEEEGIHVSYTCTYNTIHVYTCTQSVLKMKFYYRFLQCIDLKCIMIPPPNFTCCRVKSLLLP